MSPERFVKGESERTLKTKSLSSRNCCQPETHVLEYVCRSKFSEGVVTLLTKAIAACLAFFLMSLFTPSGQFLGAQDKSKPCPEPTVTSDAKFHPGQVWQYNTRQLEKSSTLTILKVESLPKLGVIIHVRVDKVRLRNCTGGPEPNKFEHMPFARDAFEKSVTKVVKEGDVPEFQDGYNEWRKACGGVYTISVAEAIAVGEETFRQNLG